MSAAATAAGYLYASGRLRGRQSKDHDHSEKQPEVRPPQRQIRVATLPSPEDTRFDEVRPQAAPKRQPTIQYRTRRWRPDDAGK